MLKLEKGFILAQSIIWQANVKGVQGLQKRTFEHLDGNSHGRIRLNEAVRSGLNHLPEGTGTQSLPCRKEEKTVSGGGGTKGSPG